MDTTCGSGFVEFDTMIYWYIISLLIYPIASGLNEVNELKHWEWHTSQLIDRILAGCFWLSMAYASNLDVLILAKQIALGAVSYWTIYDFVLSRYGYKTQTNNFFDRYSFLKIIFLPGAVCLNIF